VAAGRRFGKSEIGGHRLVTEAFKAYYRRAELEDMGKRAEFWIVGPEYSDAEKEFRILWNELQKLQVPFDRPGSYNDPISGMLHISLWKGRFQVHGKSAKHPETLVGEGLHGAIGAEAAKLKERVWTKYVRPTLNDFHGWALLTSTPEGKNWFYEAWQKGQDPDDPAWASWRRPAWSNPYVYPGGELDSEILQLRRDLSGPMFNQEIGALFTEYVGRVFQDFDEEEHVGDLSYDPTWSTYAAVDYGFTNPSVWLLIQVDPFGQRINILGECYERGMSPDEFAEEVMRRKLCPNSLITFYPEPASPGDTRILEAKLKKRATGGTGGELKYRLEAIRQALRPLMPHLDYDHPEWRPRLMVDRKCTEFIREFNDYRYPDRKDEQDKNAPELPMKKDDHTPEALGRFFAGHFGRAALKSRRTAVRGSTMS